MPRHALDQKNQHRREILLVTGMSGAGKTTALNALEDLGWEVVDNIPLSLLDRLLSLPPPHGHYSPDGEQHDPLAVGIDARTRDFDAQRIVTRIKHLQEKQGWQVACLFMDCAGAELERRYAETRRRHPLALDRQPQDGIALERELLEPLRRWSDVIIDSTDMKSNQLQHAIRERFAASAPQSMVLTLMSFGFARGLPRNADLVFDMRFLRNPHWDEELRPQTGLDAPVGDYIAQDPAYATAVAQIEQFLLTVLPRYAAEGKSYVTVAIGCTGGRHRSVHVTERLATFLRDHGFVLDVQHRNLASRPNDQIERHPS